VLFREREKKKEAPVFTPSGKGGGGKGCKFKCPFAEKGRKKSGSPVIFLLKAAACRERGGGQK